MNNEKISREDDRNIEFSKFMNIKIRDWLLWMEDILIIEIFAAEG